MKNFVAAFVAMLAVGLTVSVADAQHLLSMAHGTKVEGVVILGDKQVQLPDGEWELVYSDTDAPSKLWRMATVLLVQGSAYAHREYIMARTNLRGSTTGWVRDAYCDRHATHFNGSDKRKKTLNHDCWILDHGVMTGSAEGRKYQRRIEEYIRENAGTSTVVENRYTISNRKDYLQVRHYVNPRAYGFAALAEDSWGKSQWHRHRIARSVARGVFVAAAKAFGARYRNAVQAGFRNKLSDGMSGLKFQFEPLRQPRPGSARWTNRRKR